MCVCIVWWAGGVCQSGYPLRLSKRLMGNLLHGPNHRLSLSFQQISLFLDPFKNVIITDVFFSFMLSGLSSLLPHFAYTNVQLSEPGLS